jgi:hypothetical protein
MLSPSCVCTDDVADVECRQSRLQCCRIENDGKPPNFHHPPYPLKLGKEKPALVDDIVMIILLHSPALTSGSKPPHKQSPGAVDDVIMVGLMLELASHLAEDTQRLNGGSIVLIFNGAEETNWQAAHGFITSPSPLVQEGATPLEEPRDWRKTLRCVLNLEAIGSGGRELLVRTGRGAGWISRLYAAVVDRPRATVIAQEVFDSGIFPGQTDFVVFRDEGHIPGLDVVIVEKGYGYHSPHDRPDSITDGDIQRAGTTAFDVAGALLSAVAKGEHRAIGDGEAVFFDFLGLFMVWYPAWVGQLLNGSAVAIALVRIKDTWTSLGEELVIAAVKKELTSMLCGMICPVAFGFIIIVVNPRN